MGNGSQQQKWKPWELEELRDDSVIEGEWTRLPDPPDPSKTSVCPYYNAKARPMDVHRQLQAKKAQLFRTSRQGAKLLDALDPIQVKGLNIDDYA